MVATVNGYLCFSSCDVAKAKHGKDPRELANAQPSAPGADKPSNRQQPAVIFDGVLKDLSDSSTATPYDQTGDPNQRPSLDVLA